MAGKDLKSMFITFEGSEGCGKSTQSRMLFDYLKSKGKAVIYLREPGGVKISEKIRDILLDARNTAMSRECEMLLYMASRAQVVSDIIRPALAKKMIVICDRFLDSTVAYQGYGLGIDLALIKKIGVFVAQGIVPDLTIFLDLPVKKGLKHRESKEDRIEMRTLNYHQKVRRGYLAIAHKEPHRVKIVKVKGTKDLTQNDIRRIVKDYVF